MRPPKKSFRLDNTIIAAVIGAAATIIAAVIGGIFLIHSIASSSTNTTTATVNTVVQTPQSNTPASTNGNKPLTCTPGSLCSSFPMNIKNTTIVINQDNTSTWNFQITNNGSLTLVDFLKVRIGDENMQYGELHLNPNEAVPISVTVRFTPTNNSVQEIAFDFNDVTSGQHFEYSQSCTYLSSENICQA